jgi:hypothetical protein
MSEQVHYIPSVRQRRQALLGCGVYFFRFMRSWFVNPTGGWKNCPDEYLMRLAMIPGCVENLSPEARESIVRAQRRAAAQQRSQQAQAQK